MRKKQTNWLALLLALVLALSLTACGGGSQNTGNDGQNTNQTDGQDQSQNQPGEVQQPDEPQKVTLVSQGMMPLDYAENFTIELYEGGYRMIRGGANDMQLLVVPESAEIPEDLEEGVTVLRQPIDRVYMASTGMVSIIDAIGALDHVKLVSTDIDGWYADGVIGKMNAGEILYSGKYQEPDYEFMTASGIQLHIDTTMLDGYPEVIEKFEELEILTFIEDSSKEGHPLARVEWVKVLGVLFGMEDAAQKYFDEQKALMDAAGGGDTGKTVAMGYITSKDFTQSTAAIASIVSDMNTILTSDDPEVTTEHLIKIS